MRRRSRRRRYRSEAYRNHPERPSPGILAAVLGALPRGFCTEEVTVASEMRKTSVVLMVGLLALTVLPVATCLAADYPKVSPFEAVRWEGMTPQVRVDGMWYGVAAIDGVAVEDIMAHCARRHRGREKKRFGEDLVQVLSEMGHRPGASVDLTLIDFTSGKEFARDGVRMTAANRRAIWQANQDDPRDVRRAPPESRRRVVREHTDETPAPFAHVVKRYEYAPHQQSSWLTREQAEQDLDELEWALEDQYSYLRRTGADYRGGLDAIRANLGDGIRVADFAVQLSKLINMFGDGHTRVRGLSRILPAGYLPFALRDAEGGPVAVSRAPLALLDEAHPFVMSIDGIEIERWIAAAGKTVCAGSPQLVRRQALERLSFLDFMRQEMALPRGETVEVELASADGSSHRMRSLPLLDRLPPKRTDSGSSFDRLAGNVGYLRLGQMDHTAAAVAGEAMTALRETVGLIVDVRGNGGGSRDALRVLFPYLMPREAAPYVANAGVYRLSDKFEPDHLDARFMYRRLDPRFDARERRAIDEFAAGFEPEWAPPDGEFSDWHYLVLSPSTNPEAYHYPRPVVVLLDEDCFSATDIFLGAFAGRESITLVGTPSGGGSGRSQGIDLAHSGIRFRLSSMASFRPDGRLYDGRGIEVDVEVRPAWQDVIGRTDTQLEAALDRLRGDE